jgi:hypothetical protein
MRPKISGGAHRSRAASETWKASCVSEATSRGPAAIAIPSPRFTSRRREQPAEAAAGRAGRKVSTGGSQ